MAAPRRRPDSPCGREGGEGQRAPGEKGPLGRCGRAGGLASPPALRGGEATGHGARQPPDPRDPLLPREGRGKGRGEDGHGRGPEKRTDLSSESMRLRGSPSEDISRLPRRPPDVALQLLLPLLLPPPPPVP